MAMNLLQIVQRACRLLSIPVPTEVVNSTDAQVQQLYALANEEGDELSGTYDWQVMRRQHLFNTVASAVQSSAIPSDLDHFIANSFFNRTTMRYIYGPITPQEWQAIQAQPQLNRVFLAFIERDGQFLVTPTPAAGETIAYEYITTNWAKSAAGSAQSSFLADTDLTYLDDKLFPLGLRWRFLKSKGLDYAEDFRTYQGERNQRMARDGGNTIIDSTGGNYYGWSTNIQEGGFPG
jgi:hypothetical protein